MTAFTLAAFGALVDQEKAGLAEGMNTSDSGQATCTLQDVIGERVQIIIATREEATANLAAHEAECQHDGCPVSTLIRDDPHVALVFGVEIAPGLQLDAPRIFHAPEALRLAASIVAAVVHATADE